MWVNNRVVSELILLASSHVDNLNSIIHTGCAPSRSIGSHCWQLKEQAKNMLSKYGALKAKPIQIEACLTQLRQERTDLQAMLEAKQSNRAWRDKVKVVLASAVEQAGCPCSLYSELMSASAATLSLYAYINWTSSALWSQSNIWCTSKIWFILFVPMCIVYIYMGT